jgi:hypothetical protein
VKELKGYNQSVESSVLFADDLLTLAPYVNIEDLDSKYAARYYNISNVYTSIYCLPYDTYGRDMLRLMTTPTWKHKIIESAVGEVQDTRFVNYVCDHYDAQSKTGTLIFCVPDIARLKKFIDAAKVYNEKGKFHIICFDFQKEFIKNVSNGYADIYVTPFYEYYKSQFEC